MSVKRPVTAQETTQPHWISIRQAAASYGVSVDTIRRRIATGQLPASRCGGRIIRLRITDLDRLFKPLTAA